jgi:hypothetical protein
MDIILAVFWLAVTVFLLTGILIMVSFFDTLKG